MLHKPQSKNYLFGELIFVPVPTQSWFPLNTPTKDKVWLLLIATHYVNEHGRQWNLDTRMHSYFQDCELCILICTLKFSYSRPKFRFLSYSSASDQRKEKDQIIPLTFNEYNKKSIFRLFWAWFLVLIWNFCCGLMTLRTLHLTELSINIRSQESKNQRGFFFDQLVLIHTQPKFLL